MKYPRHIAFGVARVFLPFDTLINSSRIITQFCVRLRSSKYPNRFPNFLSKFIEFAQRAFSLYLLNIGKYHLKVRFSWNQCNLLIAVSFLPKYHFRNVFIGSFLQQVKRYISMASLRLCENVLSSQTIFILKSGERFQRRQKRTCDSSPKQKKTSCFLSEARF